MRKLILCIGILLMLQCAIYAQTYYTPASPVVVQQGSFSKEAIKNKILNTSTPSYTQADINALVEQVKLTEKTVNYEVDKKLKEINDLVILKSELRAKAGVEEMKQQLEEKKKAKEKIKTELQEALKNIDFSGYYAMIVPIPTEMRFSATNSDLKTAGRTALAAQAIETLRGTFISSLTTVKDAVLLSDYIKAVVSGSMSMISDDIQERFTYTNQQYFLWVGKVSVIPLQKDINTTTTGIPSQGSKVVNLLDENYTQSLTQKGVTQSIIDRITNYRNIEKSTVGDRNSASTDKETQILSDYNKRFFKLDAEIKELENTLANFSSVLKQYVENNTDLKFNESDIKGTVNKALAYFDNKIAKINKERLAIKGKELKSQSINNLPLTDDPAGEIADRALGLYNLIVSSYSKDDNFKSITEVNDGVTTSYTEQKSITLTREVESLWIYPIIQDNSMHVTVVAKFKITGEQQSSTTSVTTETKSNSITDTRDGKTYNTVKIGTQTWMAENLNYSPSSGSWCYDNNTSNCTKYGRLYNWETAKKVCPSGWHLPSDAEWSTLTNYVGSDEGKKLKSTSGWNSSGNGTDAYGFTALPGGYRDDDDTFYDVGHYGYWGSSTENKAADADGRHMHYSTSSVYSHGNDKTYGFSVRCVRDL